MKTPTSCICSTRRAATGRFWPGSLGISPHQLSYVTHSGEGEGLLFYGSTILPFVDHFPKKHRTVIAL